MELKQKNLHSVRLSFKPNEETENELLSKRMKDVLDVLEPHPDVVELLVFDYLGFNLARWIGSSSILSNMKTLKLVGCINLTQFPAFGQLPSLEELHITMAIKVKHIGFELYSNSLEHVNRVPFPKLKVLVMRGMNSLEVWELEHGVVMPCLHHITLFDCQKLKALPALGKLSSLEEFYIHGANELLHIGCEFLYEVNEVGGERFNDTAFPKLKSLTMRSNELDWEFGVVASTGEEIIMPCLRKVYILGFKILKPFLEVLSKLSSLEILIIHGEATEFLEYIRHDDDDDDIAREITFPSLKELLIEMEDMEEMKIGFQVMPLLNRLKIYKCNKLKAIHGSLSKLESLVLGGCAYATTFQALEDMITFNCGVTLEDMHRVALEDIRNIKCGDNTLTCMPEQIQQLTSLKKLELYNCSDEVEQRCRKDEGEDWRIISHIPNIVCRGSLRHH